MRITPKPCRRRKQSEFYFCVFNGMLFKIHIIICIIFPAHIGKIIVAFAAIGFCICAVIKENTIASAGGKLYFFSVFND